MTFLNPLRTLGHCVHSFILGFRKPSSLVQSPRLLDCVIILTNSSSRIHWQAQPVRDLSVQAILRKYGIRNPPGWRSQTRDDYIVVLMLHSELTSAEIAAQLNRKFGGKVEADGTSAGLYVEANVEACYFWTPDGSYQWWTSGLEDISERDDILRDCGVKIETEAHKGDREGI